jgi:hypothetical protein
MAESRRAYLFFDLLPERALVAHDGAAQPADSRLSPRQTTRGITICRAGTRTLIAARFVRR